MGRRERWNAAAPWRWSTAGFAAAAAALLVYILFTPATAPLVAALRAPQQQSAQWVAIVGRDGLRLTSVAGETAPAGHAFELWAIPVRTVRPEPLGVISGSGRLRVAFLRKRLGDGATLAISLEPPGGSTTGLPTGPVVFVGTLRAS